MKIKNIQNALSQQYAEREEVIEGLMVAMIARQHALLIGPPGTGKSAMVSDLTKRITGANYFQWLSDTLQYTRGAIWTCIFERIGTGCVQAEHGWQITNGTYILSR
ncbi:MULTISPECIES: AAA family ATPase [unclassified Paenibacillus]|uniref:AAA family ATPase n=1 Tax=unclassified Paenibacillus TaxID=185978 RepID=UPI00210B26F2|nr:MULTISPECIES: AAA family ATPase [unclassified Paenibacillus]